MYAVSTNPPRRNTVGTDSELAAKAAAVAVAASGKSTTTARVEPLESLVSAETAKVAARPALASDLRAPDTAMAAAAAPLTYSFARGVFPDAAIVTDDIRTADMLRMRECRRCPARFRECDNIGAWQCHAHRAEFNFQSGVFPCCNTASPSGCVSLDHSETLQYENSPARADICGALPAFRVREHCLNQLNGVQPTALVRSTRESEREYVWVLRRNPWGLAQASAQAAELMRTAHETLPNKY